MACPTWEGRTRPGKSPFVMGNAKATIVKANALIQAGYRLTLAEQRVLLAAIAQVRRDEEPTDQAMYSVTASGLADITGTSAARSYQELADAADRLYGRQVWIKGGANGEEKGKNGKRVTQTGWVQQIDYIPDQGRVEMRFTYPILPYLTMLKSQFTSYQLEHVAGMKSTHGVRLYELLVQWRQAGEREIDVGEFRRMFGVDGRYPSIKDLKKRVLEPAVRDVNQSSDLTVTWGQRKAGRKVAAFQFVFEPKNRPKTTKSGRPRITRDVIEKYAEPGESYEQAKLRLEKKFLAKGDMFDD